MNATEKDSNGRAPKRKKQKHYQKEYDPHKYDGSDPNAGEEMPA